MFNDFFAWVTHGTMPPDDPNFALIHAYEQAKTADPEALAALIRAYNMTWEMVPSEHLDKPEVWEALAERMPLTALIRNLATLTRVGTIAPMKSAWVCERLNAIGNARTEDFTRIHPINVLSALLTYRAGKGARGHHTWTPVPQVVDALDKAFERSFDTAPQTNQRFYLGRPSDRESWPARGVLSESKSHSPWSECDISAGQLARTFSLDVDIVAVEKCTVLCHP